MAAPAVLEGDREEADGRKKLDLVIPSDDMIPAVVGRALAEWHAEAETCFTEQ